MGYSRKKKQRKLSIWNFWRGRLGGDNKLPNPSYCPNSVWFSGVFFYRIAVSKASLTMARRTWRVREVATPLTNFPTKEHFEMIHFEMIVCFKLSFKTSKLLKSLKLLIFPMRGITFNEKFLSIGITLQEKFIRDSNTLSTSCELEK